MRTDARRMKRRAEAMFGGGGRLCFPTNFLTGVVSALWSIGGSATSVMIYFEDVDAVVERAVAR